MERKYQLFSRGEGSDLRLILPAISASFPIKTHKYLVTADIIFADRGDGWHNDREGQRISKIEDKAIEMLEALGMICVGHIKLARHLIIVFYTSLNGPKEIEVPSGFLKKTKIELVYREDPDWTYYYEQMSPTQKELHLNRNLQLLQTFEAQGDNLSHPRPVDFGFFFEQKESFKSFLEEAKDLGYGHSDPQYWGSPEDPVEPTNEYFCELVINTHIEADHIAQLCANLDELASKYGGEFDGWAAPIAQNPPK